MQNKEITYHINKIREIKDNYKNILNLYKSKKNARFICHKSDSIPPEITAAFGIWMVRSPYINKKDQNLFDIIIETEGTENCSLKNSLSLQTYKSTLPKGYGENGAVSIHNATEKMLKDIFSINLKDIKFEELQRVAGLYEKLRRTVRSIYAGRTLRPSLLCQKDLSLIFDTALTLPPDIALPYLTPIQQIIENSPINPGQHKIKALIYSPGLFLGEIADKIEEEGILISEDDCCTGRRSFDISLNHESQYLFYELLDTYSYRPLHPCIRSNEERFNLLYNLLKNYGIETVIFFTESECSPSNSQAEYLRIKMMRQGIDPLTVNYNNYIEITRDYMGKI